MPMRVCLKIPLREPGEGWRAPRYPDSLLHHKQPGEACCFEGRFVKARNTRILSKISNCCPQNEILLGTFKVYRCDGAMDTALYHNYAMSQSMKIWGLSGDGCEGARTLCKGLKVSPEGLTLLAFLQAVFWCHFCLR